MNLRINDKPVCCCQQSITGVDAPMIDTEESDSALGGIDPSAIARTGRGIYPAAKSTGVIAHRGKLEVRNNRVINPRRTARPPMRVASALSGLGSIEERPSRNRVTPP